MIKRISVNRAGFIFGFSILSLFLLITWWAYFLNKSVDDHRMLVYNELESKEKLFKFHILSSQSRPQMGTFPLDSRFEIIDISALPGRKFSSSLSPAWNDLYLSVRNETVNRIEREFESKKIMLIGESGLLFLIVMVSIFFLYKFVRLEKKTSAEVEEFWNRVTHELKTPVAGVKSFIENLVRGNINKNELGKFSQMALNEISRQEHLIENILSGQIASKKDVDLYPEKTDLVQYLKKYVGSNLKGSMGRLIFEEPKSIANIVVKADTDALKIILDNVVNNALRCSPDISKVRINCKKSSKKGVVLIHDKGPGFEKGNEDLLFTAFRQKKNILPGKRHGSGIGLYISRKLAKKMNGGLSAESGGEGKGATFILVLPLY